MADANFITLDEGIPRYWALLLLSIVLRLGGVMALVLTVVAMFAFASFTSSAAPIDSQPIPFPTQPPFFEMPRFEMPTFDFQLPPQLPALDAESLARQITGVVGGFATVVVLFWGVLTSIGLYASGQFLILLINHEENMRIAAESLQARMVRRGG